MTFDQTQVSQRDIDGDVHPAGRPQVDGPVPQPLAGLVVLSVGLGDVLNGMLKAAGAVVLVRGSAADMIRVLDAFVPNVIVAEVGADREEGLAVLRGIRRREPPRGGDLPVVGVAAEALPFPPGFQATLAGVFDASELARAVLGVARRSEFNGSR